MVYVNFDDEYVTVSETPWGHPGETHLVGPFDPEFADTAVAGVVTMLQSLGHRVLTVETATGDWFDDAYFPTDEEQPTTPLIVQS